jgi:hypothetical protein
VVLGEDGSPDLAASEARRAELRGQASGEQFDFGPLLPIDELRAQISRERRTFDEEMAAREESGR